MSEIVKKRVKILLGPLVGMLMAIILIGGMYALLEAYSSDVDMDWRPTYVRLPAAMACLESGTLATGSVNAQSDSGFVHSPGVGGAPLKEVGTSTVSGFLMNVGDQVTWMIPWPEQFDPRFNIAIRPLWSSLATTQIVTWKYLAQDMTRNAALNGLFAGSGVDSVSATADTSSSTVAWCMSIGKWDTLTQVTTQYYDGKMMKLGASLQAMGTTSAGGNSVALLGLELAGVPRLTSGPGYRKTSMSISGPTAKGAILRRQ